MDKQPVKIALIVGAVVLAVAFLAYGVKSANAAEAYAPSPGLDGNARSGSVGAGGSAPGMPGGPPPGAKPGSVAP